MNAIVWTKYGSPDGLQLREVATPTPKDNEVLIKVHAATASQADTELRRLKLDLSEDELIDRIMLLSKGSDGQLISTLQDINNGRPTEIESLNLEIARVAASMQPRLYLPRIELLGKMILAKSLQQKRKESQN